MLVLALPDRASGKGHEEHKMLSCWGIAEGSKKCKTVGCDHGLPVERLLNCNEKCPQSFCFDCMRRQFEKQNQHGEKEFTCSEC